MFGYFITGLAGVFWFFRIIVALMYTNDTAFLIVPINITFEIILLFITFACIILIAKRKMIGAVIYLVAQASYFGVDAYKNLQIIIEGTPETGNYLSLFISIIAVIIPILSILDIGLNRGKKATFRNKKTDWFYDNPEYERKFDEREDRNQYKF